MRKKTSLEISRSRNFENRSKSRSRNKTPQYFIFYVKTIAANGILQILFFPNTTIKFSSWHMQDLSFHMMTKQVSLLFLQKPQTLIFSGVEASYGSQVGSRRSLDGEKILTSDLGLSLSTRWAPRCSSESHSHRQIHSQISRNYLRDSCQKHPIIFPLSNGRSWPLILPSSGKVTLSS